MMTLSEAKAIYRTGKGHFFDRETFKYWGSRIESALYKNRCFVTSENNFDGSRRAYTVRRFFEKWDHCHLHDLTPAEYEEIAADIEELKTRYNYIEDIRDTFRGSRSSIPFYDIVKLSKMEPKKKGGA